ncbi:MAG: SGNH/GDSL hydrolase family protein [Candidatus Sumerlaeia bacterium]|nr:SGNH/GDSL hydrolase family protein [Candidatus Sumerlaeia bacterium]
MSAADGVARPTSPRLSARAAALAACSPGLLALALALIVNPWVLRLLRGDAFLEYDAQRIGVYAAALVVFGLVSLGLGIALGRGAGGRWLSARPARVGGVLSLGMALVMLLTVDGVLGLWTAGFRYEPRLVVPDSLLRFRLRPGWSGDIATGQATINSRGWRWREVADRPAPGTRRLLVLGDSILFGFSTDDDEIIPAQLERLVPGDVEVLNASILGYDFQEYHYFAHELLALGPDEALLGICLNDLSWSHGRRLSHAPTDPRARPLPPTRFNRLRWWVRFHSGLLNIGELATLSERSRTPAEQEAWVLECAWRLADDPAHRDEQLLLARRYLEGTKELLEAHGVPLRLVLFPYRFQFEPDLAARHPGHVEIHAGMRRIADDLGLPMLDLLDPLGAEIARRGGDPATLYFDINHFNAEGSRVCAELIAQWMRDVR